MVAAKCLGVVVAVAAGVAVVLSGGCAARRVVAADVKPSTMLARTVTVEEGGKAVEHKYAVWLPAGYDGEKEFPCVVFLHGSGECGTDGVKQTKVGLAPAAAADPGQWPCVVVMPQKPTNDAAWEDHDAMVMKCLEATEKELAIDSHRVSLTGLSQGGHGSWTIGARHAGVWSAVVPVCGYGKPDPDLTPLAGVPVWAFHGAKDDVVPPEESVRLTKAVKTAWENGGKKGPEPKLTVFPYANHNAWDGAYRESGLGEWMMGQRRRWVAE